MKFLSVLMLLLSSFAFAGEGPGAFSYEGRLYNDSGTPVTATNVTFRVQIYDAGANCVLYEESFVRDLSATHGLFSLGIGSGVPSATYLGSLRSAMLNDGQPHTVNGCTYTSVNRSDRKVKIAVIDASSTVSDFSDFMSIASAAYSMSADSLQGFAPTDFVRLNTAANLTQANVEDLFTNTGFSNLQKVAQGQFLERTASGTVLPRVSTPPATAPAAGTVWYDNTSGSMKYSTGSTVVDLAAGGAGGGGSGVTSVGLSMPSIFQVSNSPVTSTGNLTADLKTQNANLVFAGPALGSATAPTFRALASTDLPAGGYDATYARLDGNRVASAMSLGTKSNDSLTLQTNALARLTILANGTVGIGTTSPATQLDVAGGLRIGNESAGCSAALDGTIRYSTANGLEICKGSTWQAVAVGIASGLTSLNGLTSSIQTFDKGTAGLEPGWVSASNRHTLNIPLASSASVTAGLISKTDYDAFSAKQTSDLTSGNIWVGNGANKAVAVTVSGDISFPNTGSVTVQKLQGKGVSNATPVDAQVLRWNTGGSGAWTPGYVGLGDIRTTTADGVFSNSNCSASQSLFFNSATGKFECQSISISSSQVSFGTVSAKAVYAGPTTGSSGTPAFRILEAADIPTSVVTQWTTNGSNISYSTGNVGIGSSSPNVALEVNGVGSASAVLLPRGGNTRPSPVVDGYIRYNNGTTNNYFEGAESGSWTRFLTSKSGFLNGGNSFGSDASLGTIDAKNLAFKTANTQRMVIGSNGNVGIGTTMPTANLQVNDAFGFPVVQIGDGSVGSQPALYLKTEKGDSVLGANTGGDFEFFPTSGATYFWNKDQNLKLLSISETGIGIGTNSPNTYAILDINGTGSKSAMVIPRGTTPDRSLITTAVNGMIRYNTTDSDFEIYQGGSWRVISFTTPSDSRLKNFVEPVSGALDSIDRLRPVTFYWDQTNPRAKGLGDTREIGFIAQELEKVLPEVVHVDSEGYRTVEYGKIVSLAIAAIKELKSQLGLSRDENALLKAEIENLKADSAKSKADVDAMKAYLCTHHNDAPWCH